MDMLIHVWDNAQYQGLFCANDWLTVRYYCLLHDYKNRLVNEYKIDLSLNYFM